METPKYLKELYSWMEPLQSAFLCFSSISANGTNKPENCLETHCEKVRNENGFIKWLKSDAIGEQG